MNLLRFVAAQHRMSLVGASLLSVLSAALSVSVIAFIEQRLLGAQAHPGDALWQFGLLLSALFMASLTAQLTMRRLGHRVVYEVRRSLVKRVLDCDIARLERIGSAALLACLNKDAGEISMALVTLPNAIYGTAVCIGAFGYLAWLSPKLFLSVASWIAVTVILASRLVGQSERWFTLSRDVEDSLQENYQALVLGQKELTLNRLRARMFYEAEFSPNAQRARSHGLRADAWATLTDSFVSVMALGAIGLCFLVAHATGWASQAVAATYGLTLLFLGTPLASVVNAVPHILAGSVALRKIEGLDFPQLDPHFQDSEARAEPLEQLALKHVYFRYPPRDGEAGFEIGPIDLELRRGELVFIVGGNGSGKSTLARLLCGLTTPAAGRVWLNGRALAAEDCTCLRALCSSVFSDFHLFTQLLGPSGEAAERDVTRWLTRLQLSHKQRIAAGRLSDTRLSTGQRKRLALLLAVLEDRPLLLLDEWAADQDPSFRRLFYTELLPQLRAAGKTVVAITHDEHYFGVADRVLKLDEGRLIPLAAADTRPMAVDARA